MTRPNKKKVAVDRATLTAAKMLATAPQPPGPTTTPAPSAASRAEPPSPGKKELKWQRGELREAKLIVKMGDRLERAAADDFLVACRLFEARGGGAGSGMGGGRHHRAVCRSWRRRTISSRST